ncbi:MAG: hemolysin family protein [Planctomycetota bacterium]|jgi:putative hemolysin
MPYQISVFLVCLLASGFFSGSETALIGASRLRLRRLAEEGDATARRILQLVKDPRLLLAGILVGNNIVNILAAVVAGSYFVALYGEGLGAIMATAVATPLIVLFSEFLPKTLAAIRPIRFSRWVVRPLRVSLYLLWPIVWPLEAITRPLGAALHRSREPFGIAELRVAVAEGVRSGTVDPTLARVLHGGLSLEWKTAGDILVPRVDVVGVDADASYRECLAVFRKEKFSRLLVMEGALDADLGYLAAKDLARLDEEARAGWTARQGAREALRVPVGLPLPRLLARMRQSGVHLAIVKDEYGGTAGIVTLEDVLEELVGEIRDEHDTDEIAPIRLVRPNTWVVRGDVSVKELNQRLGIAIPAEEARTVGGYLAEALRRLPAQDEAVDLADARLVVQRVHENRVLEVLIQKGRPPAPTS